MHNKTHSRGVVNSLPCVLAGKSDKPVKHSLSHCRVPKIHCKSFKFCRSCLKHSLDFEENTDWNLVSFCIYNIFIVNLELHSWKGPYGIQPLPRRHWGELNSQLTGSCFSSCPDCSSSHHLHTSHSQLMPLEQWLPTIGSPDVLGLQLPEILASTATGEGFWQF